MSLQVNEAESAILKAAIGLLPPGPFTFTDLQQTMGGSIVGAELRFALWQLHKSAIVQSFRKLSGERLYLIPLDWQMKFIPLLFGLPDPGCVESDAVVADRLIDGKDIVMDMITLLGRISVRPMKLSKKGIPPKLTVDDWARQISLNSEAVQPIMSRIQTPVPYPPSIALLLEIGMRSGLLEWQAGTLSIHGQRLQAWLRLSDREMHRYLHRSYLPAFAPHDPLARAVVIALHAFPERRWISWSGLQRWWETNIAHITTGFPKRQSTNPSSDSHREELHVLQELGWVETGTTAAGETVFRTSFPADLTEERLYIQPDGEIMLPFGQAYRLHYLLAEFAKPVRRDRMCVYLLTRESLLGALSQDWRLERIIAFLKRHSADGIPEHVTDLLKEWAGTFATYRIDPVTAVRFADRETADTIASHPELASCLTPDNRLNDTTFIVDPETDKQVREIFNRLGLVFMPQSESRETESVCCDESASMQERDCGGLFHSLYSTDAYTFAKPAESATSLYRGLASIPAAWYNEQRAYHLSTVRSLMEHAIIWQCSVQIDRLGDSAAIAPIRIGDDKASVECSVFGTTSVIPLAEIERVRLILPGISNS